MALIALASQSLAVIWWFNTTEAKLGDCESDEVCAGAGVFIVLLGSLCIVGALAWFLAIYHFRSRTASVMQHKATMDRTQVIQIKS